MILATVLILVGGQDGTARAQDFNFDNRLVALDTETSWDAVVDSNIDFLALRSGPSIDSSELTRIPPGARIKVHTYGSTYNSSPGFCRVSYRGVHGYAHNRYFTVIGESRY